MTEPFGVVVMAYGTPASPDDVERYYTDIRRGRPPSPEQLADLRRRYDAIGGTSPLAERTEAQRAGLQAALERRAPGRCTVVLGQKHSPPFITDAMQALAEHGIERAVGFVLAPHYSGMSIGDYERRARRGAAEAGWNGSFEMVESWATEPGFVSWTARRVKETIERLHVDDPLVVFSAHSLPEKILKENDPYPDELSRSAGEVAHEAGVGRWQIAWQSAGRTEEPWLGPDILEVIDDAAKRGEPGIVLCPIGFVADHLEVLYDVDIEAKEHAERMGLPFERTAMPNDDPEFLDVIAGVVERAIARLP
jgi:ferrochelatase